VVSDPGPAAIERGIGTPQKLVRLDREVPEPDQHGPIPLDQQAVSSGAPHESWLPGPGIGIDALHLPDLPFLVVHAVRPRPGVPCRRRVVRPPVIFDQHTLAARLLPRENPMPGEWRSECAVATPRLEREPPRTDEEVVVTRLTLARERVGDGEIGAQGIRQRDRARRGLLVLRGCDRGSKDRYERGVE